MLMQFGATTDSFSRASTMVSRIGTDAHLYDDPEDVSIVPLLDSKFDSEKCEALKRLLALIAQGFDVSIYFPQVVKNVASHSVEVKKLVYLYLLHYAEKRPDETLLSINCFQKDLGDPNPLVRAWALRTMAGIRLHVIAHLVLVAVGKCARDPSVYVRKCAAIALPKLHDLCVEEHSAAIEEIIGMLLKDNSPAVVGAAAAAFASTCPHNLYLIGKNYKRLCEILPDVEEWGQIVLVGILLRYAIAKHGLVEESIIVLNALIKHNSETEDPEPCPGTGKLPLDDASFVMSADIAHIMSQNYFEGPDKYLSVIGHVARDSFMVDSSCVSSSKSNGDVKILLQCTSPLLWSYNSAVVLAAAGVHWIMAPIEEIPKIVKPLLFLLRSSSHSKYVVLASLFSGIKFMHLQRQLDTFLPSFCDCKGSGDAITLNLEASISFGFSLFLMHSSMVLCNIQVFVKAVPSLFSPYFEDFFVSSSDSYQIKTLKLEILYSIATYSSITSIFQEFQDYARDPDRRFAADTVDAIGLCAQRLPDVAGTCLEALLFLALSEFSNKDTVPSVAEEIVSVQVIKSIKAIIKQDPPSHERVIACLVRKLDSICAAEARAVIIWMIGEYSNIGELLRKTIPTVLKYLARCFTLEAVETKLQILNACVKVLLRGKEESTSEVQIVVGYILELAKCDLSYDVRDRVRALKKIHSHCMQSHHLHEVNDHVELKNVTYLLAEYIFGGKTNFPSEPYPSRFYLPGSLSQIVLHAAPGYEPLPEPCGLLEDEIGHSTSPALTAGVSVTETELNEVDDYDENSGSSDQESASEYGPQSSSTGSSGGGSSNSDDGEETGELIHLSDGTSASRTQFKNLELNISPHVTDYGGLMPNSNLESWLNENPISSQSSSEVGHVPRSLVRFSIKNISQLVKPKSYVLLDPANGNGLSVSYIFSSEMSSISPQLVCLDVSFSNHSTEAMLNLLLSEEESNLDSLDKSMPSRESQMFHGEVKTIVPMDKIDSLSPGKTTNKTLQVHFEHHLLPLKLVLWCNGIKQSVKLRPDIGYFIKPLLMDVEAFSNKEAQLGGMLECIRRCTFTDHISQLNDEDDHSQMKDNFQIICEKLATKMLSNANLFLVSVDMPVAANINDLTGLCLRFSGEILSNSLPCLITLTVEGTCLEPLEVSVKVNCEETVFGLNLLNRVVNILFEPTLKLNIY